MKEVTRIHIAKVSYDAELEAKRELETYLKALEAYTEDADVLEDVEVRMTEILLDRGVKKGGVITSDDVAALREQLGEPRDFKGDGGSTVDIEDEEKIGLETSRKLFRDTGRAVMGGVLAGIAAFFKVSPALVRIIFIIVAFASGGTALLVYIVLWIAVPPAKTAADKLQMNGQAVTLSSIRQLNESEAHVSRSTENAQGKKVLLILLGIFSIFGAVGSAIITFLATGALLVGQYNHYIQMGDGAGFFIAAFALAVASGLLLTTLFILAAYASLAMRATRRVIVSMTVIIVVGLLSFGTALGLAQYGSLRYGDAIKANVHEEALQLPEGAAKMDGLVVDAPGMQVIYVVSNDTPKATTRSFAGNVEKARNVSITLEGTVLKVSGAHPDAHSCGIFWCDGSFVTIYGPALQQITSEKKTNVDYAAETQDRLAITTKDGADVVVSKGKITTLSLMSKASSEIMASPATVSKVEANLENGTNVELGTIAELTVHSPTSCPAGGKVRMELVGLTSNTLMLNDQRIPSKNIPNGCIAIDIEGNEE